MSERPHLFISTGEVSGDRIGSLLAGAIREMEPHVHLSGVGGEWMAQSGVALICNTVRLGAVGLTEAFPVVPGLLQSFLEIRRAVKKNRPDAAVLIGHDLFNVCLAFWLKHHKIPTISYFPPQVWLWKTAVRPMARGFDCILTSFPEEHEVYSRYARRVIYVGHYLLDELGPVAPTTRIAAREALGIDLSKTVVGLLPGSRAQEIKTLVPILLDAARILQQRNGEIQFLLPVAEPSLNELILRLGLRMALEQGCPITTLRDSRVVMQASDLLLVCSGTATLEALILGIPMVSFYRVSTVTLAAVNLLLRLSFLESKRTSFPNVLSRSDLIPEFHQAEIKPQRLAEEAWGLLSSPVRREAMCQSFSALREGLGEGGSLPRAAAAVLEVVRNGDGGELTRGSGSISVN